MGAVAIEGGELAPAGALACFSESLQHRDSLLAATARASRLLLETPDVAGAVPQVLRILGEAAGADRVKLARLAIDPDGSRWLDMASEWSAPGVPPYPGGSDRMSERDFERRLPLCCEQLRAGRSVCMTPDGEPSAGSFEGQGTKTKALVPIVVDGEFLGCVAFDNTRQQRAIDQAELSALETAAGVIGAALHRERLMEAVRREREQAAEQRMAELARANAVIRANLERLAGESNIGNFLGTVLLEATRQFDAASGMVIIRKDSPPSWHIAAHVSDGRLTAPPVAASVPVQGHPLGEYLDGSDGPVYCSLTQEEDCGEWPGMPEYHHRESHVGMLVSPLVFGGRNVGVIVLCFRRRGAEEVGHSELLVALAHQATLAIEILRLAHSAKEAAVLMERNRIGREIHDGLAQAFTGILMQLAAADELQPAGEDSTQAMIRNRIRDLAREGLAEARRSVGALRPDQTRRGGLELALRQLAERASVHGRVACSFEGGASATGLPPEHEHALLRIAQEAVSNAVRHADPANVRICLTGEDAHWLLSVTDDGRGLDDSPERCASQGFGLTSMRERATAIGGEWRIESTTGTGTCVSVRLPRRKAA
ncbi:MAG TPA: GAF domain-containing sensor histidine kinase [Steroidobacteraceae bacterium]|nr:GAF domain-containing sensor histidine kinase [Steroidobacteraceae bacterium]